MLEKIPETLGKALYGVRAGIEQTLYEHAARSPEALTLTSAAFRPDGPLDPRFTADGPGVFPPLTWTGVPAEARELVLIVEDADSPTPKPIVHLILHRLPAADGAIGEGALSGGTSALATGRNTFGKTGWLPPDPPSGHGDHRYCFQIFALNRAAGLADSPGRSAVEEAVKAHGIARGRLIGTYQRG